MPTNSFSYKRYLRLDYTNDGYEIHSGPTSDYWIKFKDEKDNCEGHVYPAIPCRKIEDLIAFIPKEDKEYNLITHNCKHFARDIFEKMT